MMKHPTHIDRLKRSQLTSLRCRKKHKTGSWQGRRCFVSHMKAQIDHLFPVSVD